MSPRLHDPLAFHGRVEMVPVESEVLRDNPLGDPHRRELPVYVPPGAGPGARCPLIVALAGFTSRGQSQLETHPWKRGPVHRYDEAVAAGEVPPAVVALPDAFTALGGSQYVNSSAVGAYEDHLVDELIPLLDGRDDVLPGRRGVCGVSSGGFGALHLALHHPGLFQACGSISGDLGFENLFGGEFLACLRGLIPHGGDPAAFLEAFRDEPSLDGDGHAVINVLAMAACYSPNPEAPLGFDLPFDLQTGARREDVWQRWLDFDPLRAVERHPQALGQLEFLHLEAGRRDEFHLQWGLRRFVQRLSELGIPYAFEEHDGGHRGLGARYVPLWGRMAAVLAG